MCFPWPEGKTCQRRLKLRLNRILAFFLFQAKVFIWNEYL